MTKLGGIWRRLHQVNMRNVQVKYSAYHQLPYLQARTTVGCAIECAPIYAAILWNSTFLIVFQMFRQLHYEDHFCRSWSYPGRSLDSSLLDERQWPFVYWQEIQWRHWESQHLVRHWVWRHRGTLGSVEDWHDHALQLYRWSRGLVFGILPKQLACHAFWRNCLESEKNTKVTNA